MPRRYRRCDAPEWWMGQRMWNRQWRGLCKRPSRHYAASAIWHAIRSKRWFFIRSWRATSTPRQRHILASGQCRHKQSIPEQTEIHHLERKRTGKILWYRTSARPDCARAQSSFWNHGSTKSRQHKTTHAGSGSFSGAWSRGPRPAKCKKRPLRPFAFNHGLYPRHGIRIPEGCLVAGPYNRKLVCW